MNYESVILILFVIASFVAMAMRRLNLPYTIALMAVGLVLGSLHLLNPPHLTQELLYAVFLPPLIFETAIHLKFSDMQKDMLPITTLVIPGVILLTLGYRSGHDPCQCPFYADRHYHLASGDSLRCRRGGD